MENVATAQTSAAHSRHGIDASLLDRRIEFEDGEVSKEKIKEILDNDIRGYFHGDFASLEDLIFSGGFASYEGKRAELLATLEDRESLHFLVLSYLGKMQNALRTPYRTPDLSSIAFLNRLDFFAKTAGEITGKDTSVTIAAENKAFETSIFRTGRDLSEQMIESTRGFIRDFGLTKVRVEPLEKFLGGEEYYREFEEELELERADSELRNSSGFRHIYDIFYMLYPTETFEESVRLYTSKSGAAEIAEWTTESALRYSAFHEARAKTDFWGRNRDYIRSSVSSRPNVLVFQYGPGRVSPFNGVSTMDSMRIGTEYFSDLVGDSSLGKVVFSRLKYNGLPFVFNTGADA
jgi:hypothetical protein